MIFFYFIKEKKKRKPFALESIGVSGKNFGLFPLEGIFNSSIVFSSPRI